MTGTATVAGQPATTAGGMRAAADLIERSGITGLSVTCADDRISIQVTAGAGDAQSRAAAVARLAAGLRSTAAQEDSQDRGRSWITAHGTAAGLPVEVFTPLTVQHAGTGPDGQQLLLAAAPDGRITQAAPPHHLPDGYRWVTDLDPSPPAAAVSGAPGRAVQPATSAALRAAASPDPGPPGIRPDRAASPGPPPHAGVRPATDAGPGRKADDSPMPEEEGQIMTTSGSQEGSRPRPGTHEEAAQRAAADFLASSGVHHGMIIAGYTGRFDIRVAEPYFDAAARQTVVTRLAGLIGGTVRQEDDRYFPMADLVAEGTVAGLRAKVSTQVHARWTGSRTGTGLPLAEAPGGQVTGMPGNLPDGWRWVTELSPAPAPALPASDAPALAAGGCPPLTSAALQSARREQAAAGQPARNGARHTRRLHGRAGS